MTTPHQRWLDDVNSEPCLTCGAMPGVPCGTASGRASSFPHAPRTQLAAAKGGMVQGIPRGGFVEHSAAVRGGQAEGRPPPG